MNKGDITDTEMDNILDGIVDSLFSLFATLGNFEFMCHIYPVVNLLNLLLKKELCRLFRAPKVMLPKWLLKSSTRSCVKAWGILVAVCSRPILLKPTGK